MIRTLAAAALATAMTTAPAFARDAAPRGQQTRLHYDARSRQYCASGAMITGSMLQPRMCRTREQWAALGVAIPDRS